VDASDGVRYACYAVIYAVWAAALAYSVRRHLAERDLEPPAAEPAVPVGEAPPPDAGKAPAPSA
jgi:hypothetical protein